MNDAIRTPGAPERRDFLTRHVDNLVHDISYFDSVIADLRALARFNRERDQKQISESLAVAKIANEKLVLAALAAQDSSAAAEGDSHRKTLFLSMLSHELRSPLGAIVTGASLLERQVAGMPGAVKTISIVKRQAAHLARLVDDLLDASRITNGKIELQCRRVNLREVLDGAIESAQPLIDAAQQRIDVDMACEPSRLFGDPVRLTQLFSNLLVNASKFSPPGTVISIAATEQATSVSVSIRDQGAGIAPESQVDVFSLFMQAGHAEPYSSAGGMGIGLSLARTLAELHGGTVTLFSDGIGHGSTFTVVLPFRPQPVEA